ncbi:MAG: sulfatase-like hydrolase/transferase, partial [Kiritimatiellales bacterium]
LNRRDKSRPFMLWSSWIKPHPPFESPAPWSKLYRPEEVGHPYRPEDGAEFLTLWNKIQNRYKWRDAGIDENLMRTMRAAYLGCISFIDYNIGRVLAALGDEVDNTLIIFASDHGELLGDYNSVGKRCMIDASVRVPLIVRWPKNFNAGAQCDTPVSLLDIRPTFLAAAGIKDDKQTRGSDLAAVAAGEEKDRAVVSQFQKKDLGLYMLATRDRKYVYSAADRKELLLDISGDALSAEEKIMDALAETAAFRKQLTGILENDGIEYASGNGGWKEYPAPDLGLDDPDCGLLYQDSARGGEVLQERINELPEEYRRDVYKTGEDAIQLILGTINLTK